MLVLREIKGAWTEAALKHLLIVIFIIAQGRAGDQPPPPTPHTHTLIPLFHVWMQRKGGRTWTQGAAGALLHRHALTEGSSVERRRVGAGARALLHASAAAHVTGRPVRPR